ncbi:TetR/AcrR family transcriptional regulator [Amycolatopsis endophytica]|uniref:AcrR family transcriptional regulator n=1 Tax=Amycolatopsis endophytica TaxID=860233 RepID=A0A853BCF6_9PSEU|nr:TetR/AcrR family transcriptional regulator [Amycolatopsis endophytica]NYI93078.1 AcrR family transcriptional regulator [Amycolatopsis endophytica]
MGDRYHHGNLRDELVRVSLDLIAERGVAGFSVAEVARRAGVSPAAPYRHFPERESLLAAVAATVAGQLADRAREAIAAEDDPVGALAAAAGAYTAYLIDRRAGMNLIYADGLQGRKHAELHEHTRSLTDQFLVLCLAVCDRPQDGLELMEQLFTQAHGYGMFWLDGVFVKQGYSPGQVVTKSVAAARILIEGHRRR